MRLPTLSSLLCLAGLASLPANAYEGDDPNIKSIPVGFLSDCLLHAEVLTMTSIAPNPQPFSGMNDPVAIAACTFMRV